MLEPFPDEIYCNHFYFSTKNVLFSFSLVHQITWEKQAETITLNCWVGDVALNPTESQCLMFAVLIDGVDILLWKAVRGMFNNPAQLMMLNMHSITMLQQPQFCMCFWVFVFTSLYLCVCMCVQVCERYVCAFLSVRGCVRGNARLCICVFLRIHQ